MQFDTTDIKGLVIIEPVVHMDHRGAFSEVYQEERFSEAGISDRFVQDNEVVSAYGVLRGMHYQLPPSAQSKLIRVVRGAIFDVAVDIRPDSETFGKWFGIELSEGNRRQLYVPHGFAHGYLSLQDDTVVVYKCDAFYAKETEGGIIWNDKSVGIRWPALEVDYRISEKDQALPDFRNHRPWK